MGEDLRAELIVALGKLQIAKRAYQEQADAATLAQATETDEAAQGTREEEIQTLNALLRQLSEGITATRSAIQTIDQHGRVKVRMAEKVAGPQISAV